MKAHSFKGSAASLGMKNMAAIAKKLQLFEYDSAEKAAEDLNAINAQFSKIEVAFEKLLGKI